MIFKTKSPQETMQLGQQLASRMESRLPVLLFGDLGSGKTHFTKGIAKGLGIDGIVKSPTFAYVNEYAIPSGKRLPLTALFHYDLYRLESADNFHTIGLEDTLNDPEALNVIEWADRLGEHLPKDYIRVECEAGEAGHEVRIEFVDSEIVGKNFVEHYWDKWQTPIHVRKHCQKVGEVAATIGEAFVKKGILVDLNLIKTAGQLHDMARVCDFNKLDRSVFQEEVTDEKWEAWVHQRAAFEGQHHADIAHADLLKDGFKKTAEVIRLHNSLRILKEPEAYHEYLEAALVYYADKRVKHDQVVDLAERFRDARERNGGGDEAKEALYRRAQEKKCGLEEWIFGQVEMKAEEVS